MLFQRYEIGALIRETGMSRVFKGIDTRLHSPVAIKLLSPDLARDSSFIARFEREARVTAGLRNSRIVVVLDCGVESGDYYIVMEYVDGTNLHLILNEVRDRKPYPRPRGIPEEVALAITEEIAYGLKVAHESNVIHRDIKPSNVLVSRNGEVKIADFGIARDLGEQNTDSVDAVTRTGTLVGSPAYMSPEQAAGRPKSEIGQGTDIFSLGIVLYELLSGERPFPGERESQILERIIQDPPKTLTLDRCPLINARIQGLLESMLEKDPAQRLRTMDQVLLGVKECIESIDSAFNVFRDRREYLSRLVADPVGFSLAAVRENVEHHLRKGLFCQQREQGRLDEAARHFQIVLAMQPDNVAAKEALLAQEGRTANDESSPEPELSDGPSSNAPSHARSGSEAGRLPPPAVLPTSRGDGAPARGSPGRALRLPGRLRLGDWRIPLLGAVVLWVVLLFLWMAPGHRAASHRATTALLQLESDPPGAQIQLRGPGQSAFQRTDRVTNCYDLVCAPGRWDVRLQSAGFLPDSLSVELAAGDTTRRVFQLQPAVSTGVLSVITTPAGAVVKIYPLEKPEAWRTLANHTPLTERLAATAWGVEVDKAGYGRQDTTVMLATGEHIILRLTLREPRSTGILAVDSDPRGARLILNCLDASVPVINASTPYRGAVPVGTWRLHVSTGHRDTALVVLVTATREKYLLLNLAAVAEDHQSPGTIVFSVSHPADVFLDGRSVASNTRRVECSAETDRSHCLQLRSSSILGSKELCGLQIPSSGTLDLGLVTFKLGTIVVSTRLVSQVILDGELQAQTTPFKREIAVGDHKVSVVLVGYRVGTVSRLDASMAVIETLRLENGQADRPTCTVVVGENEVTRVRFDLEKER